MKATAVKCKEEIISSNSQRHRERRINWRWSRLSQRRREITMCPCLPLEAEKRIRVQELTKIIRAVASSTIPKPPKIKKEMRRKSRMKFLSFTMMRIIEERKV